MVTGVAEVAIDFLHKSGKPAADITYEPSVPVTVLRQSSGAWHLTNVFEALVEDRSAVLGVKIPPSLDALDHMRKAHTIWAEYPRSTRDEEPTVTRVAGYMGTEAPRSEGYAEWLPRWPTEAEDRVGVLVTYGDSTREMGSESAEKVRDVLVQAQQCPEADRPWIVVTRGPSPGAEAWSDSTAEMRQQRVIMVLGGSNLRQQLPGIPRDGSWDSIASAVVQGLRVHPSLKDCRWVIASFSGEAIVAVQRVGEVRRAWIAFDPSALGKAWFHRYPGNMVGLTTCVVATIAQHLHKSVVTRQSIDGADEGLEAVLCAAIGRTRKLHVEGYRGDLDRTAFEATLLQATLSEGTMTHDRVNPTTRAICAYQVTEERQLKLVALDAADQINLLDTALRRPELSALGASTEAKRLGLAVRLVMNGPGEAEAAAIPCVRFGKLTAIDPREIEGLRAVASLFETYLTGTTGRPLSIAVFGQPGSGKSFGIKQLAAQLHGRVGKMLTFNISQFADPDMLIGALHQVRDEALRGAPPLVFWDEFDAPLGVQERGWLRYFLAPMQDGEFVEGQITHPIGRAIFVFAGGTSKSMAEFVPDKLTNEHRAIKLPDFLSRLHGSLDVLGPNRVGEVDDYYQIRRALLLYGLLKEHCANVVDGKRRRIDEDLVRALLTTELFKYGSRSLEAILRMSSVHGVRNFSAACLPSTSQLNLHVDATSFMRALRGEP